MFCREMFGKKPKKLDFGLQPHKIPDCEVVRALLPGSVCCCGAPGTVFHDELRIKKWKS